MEHNSSDTDPNYPTDKFGRPNGRNHHYRIPLNDERAATLASRALNGLAPFSDRFVVSWDEFSGDRIAYMGIKTSDSKGHLQGLAEYAHSPKWQNVSSRVSCEIDEYRSGRSGGTKVRGSFRVDPMSFNGATKLGFSTVLDVTPTELESALENRGDTWKEIQDTIRYAKDESIKNARERIAEQQRNCEHEHAVFPENHIGETARSDGYCEDCGAEITQNKELAY